VNQELRDVLDALDAEVDAAREDSVRPRTGMRVSFHGDFTGAPPRVLGRLKWWVLRLREAAEK
jgi:hypothetical protein